MNKGETGEMSKGNRNKGERGIAEVMKEKKEGSSPEGYLTRAMTCDEDPKTKGLSDESEGSEGSCEYQRCQMKCGNVQGRDSTSPFSSKLLRGGHMRSHDGRVAWRVVYVFVDVSVC